MPIFRLVARALVLTSACTLASAQVEMGVQSTPPLYPSYIDYVSASDAYSGLRAKPGVQFEVREGWTFAHDTAKRAVWSFAPQADPAFPAAVERRLVEIDGKVTTHTRVFCEANKPVCDDFVRRFTRLDEAMAQAAQPAQAAKAAASAP